MTVDGPVAAEERRTTHPGLLADLMSTTLDVDYQAVADQADRSGQRPGPRNRVVATVVVVAFGGMLGVSAIRTERDAPIAAAERDQLVAQIHERQDNLDSLHTKLANQESAVAELQRAAGVARSREQQLRQDTTSLAGLTGVTAVHGPGVEITVNDAPGARGTTQGGVILDTDLQALVNGLWTAGAEAVAINGHRLTSLSAIRYAGRAITVDYRSLTPPYVLDAIGDPDTLPARLMETPGGQAWLGLKANYGIRFDTVANDDLVLPGDTDAAVRQARAVTR